MSDIVDEMGDFPEDSDIKLPPQVKGKLEYHSTAPVEAKKELDELFETWFKKREVAFTGRVPSNQSERQQIFVVPYSMFETAIQALVDKAVVAARRESSKRLVDEIATYGDGQTVYFNKEAVVPISRVLAELNGAKIE